MKGRTTLAQSAPTPPPARLQPDGRDWRAHVALLERRALAAHGLEAARLHHQRAVVLDDALSEPLAATAAWAAALAAAPTYLSARRAFRAHVIALEDAQQAAALWVPLPGDTPADLARAAALWIFRWPAPARVAQVLGGAPAEPFLDRLARLGLPNAALRARLAARPELDSAERALLARLCLDAGDLDAARAVLAVPSAPDLRLAWLRVETAPDDATLADALVALAAECTPGTAGALYYLAAERRAGAEALLARAAGGRLDDVIDLGRVLRARGRPGLTDALSRCTVDDARLQVVLGLRVAERLDVAGDADAAWARALAAWHRQPALAHPVLERLAAAGQRWAEWAAALTEGPTTATREDRLVASALFELALDDPARARKVLGPPAQGEAVHGLWARQRLALRVGDTTCKAWQIEARHAPDADRRVELFLHIARTYLGRAGGLDRALTYLFWILDHDAAHLTALRLLLHACRGARRARPLMEVLTRLEPLLDEPAARAAALTELAALWETDDPERAVPLYAKAVALAPDLRDAVAGLERACLAAEAFGALADLYRQQLERAEAGARRSELGLRLGLLLEGRLDDPEAALAAYTEALAADVEGANAPRLREAVARLEPAERDEDTLEFDVPITDPGEVPFTASEQFEALLTRVTEAGTQPHSPLSAEPRTAPIPMLSPLPEMPMPALRLDEPPPSAASALDGDTMPRLEANTEATPAPVEGAVAAFLGAEQARASSRDPARAAVLRKLARARRGGAGEWPDHGRAELAAAIEALQSAPGGDERFAASIRLAEVYEAHGHVPEAVRAWQAALGWRAGAAEAEGRLEALLRRTEQHRALADLLAGRAQRTGDPTRRRALLLEVARIYSGPMSDPGSAVPHLREAYALGADPAVGRALAEALKAIRKWTEYAAVLEAAGLDRPDPANPEWTLQVGRVHLYERRDAERALPFVVMAARALPERVDVAADLAEARAALGEVGKAVALLERCLAGMTDRAWARQRATLSLRIARLIETFGDDADRVRLAYRAALEDGVRDPAVIDRCERLATQAQDWPTLAVVARAALEEAALRGAAPAERRALAVRLGHVFARRLEKPYEAAEAFVYGFELDPDDAETFRAARGLVERLGDSGLQVRLYRAWLGHAPADAPERLGVGLGLVGALEDEDRLDEAVAEVNALAELWPSAKAVARARERVLRAAGRWDTLVTLYEAGVRAASLAPERLERLRLLAHAQEVGRRDLQAASHTWRQVLGLAPDDPKALRALARLLEARKQWRELLEISERELAVTSSAKKQAHILFRMGSLQETQLGDRAAASACYQAAVEADPRCFPALHGLRDLAVGAGDWPAVIANLRTELQLWDAPKERAAVLSRIAEIEDQHLGDRDAAVAHYQEALVTWADSVPAARFLADLAFDEGRWADAAPLFQALSSHKLEKWPRAARADLFHKRGVVATRLHRRREAVESLKLALDFEPGRVAALEALVEAAGEPPSAEDEADIRARIEAAAEAGADGAELDVVRGRAAEARDDLGGAVAAYQRAAEARPDELSLRLPLVALYTTWRRWTEATEVLRAYAERLAARAVEVPELRARYIEALEREGAIWSDLAGEPARAVACYHRVLRLAPRRRRAILAQAQCHVLQGAFDEARALMRRMLAYTGEMPPAEHAELLFYLGRVAQLGWSDAAEAEAHFRRALAVDPRCASAALGLLRLLDQRGDTTALMDAVAGLGERVAEAPADAAGAALRIYVAGLRLRHDDAEGAHALLTPLAAADGPGARPARFALVQVHDHAGSVDRAARPLLTILDRDVTDVDALQTLAELLERHGEHERLLHVLAVLALFRALTPELKATFDRLSVAARHQREAARRALGDDTLHAYVAHESFSSPLVRMVDLCAPALAEQFELGAAPSLAEAVRVTGRRHPFSFHRRAIEGLIDHGDFELWFDPRSAEAMSIWPNGRPRIVVGQPLLDGTAQERQFMVARAVFYCRAGLAPLYNLGYGRRMRLFRTLDALFMPGQGESEAAKALVAGLDAKAVAAVRDLIAAAGTQTLPALFTGEAVMAGVSGTADRVGLLACGALRPAVEALLRVTEGDAQLPRGEDLRWAVRSAPRLRDMVKYSLSEAHARARHAADLALRPD